MPKRKKIISVVGARPNFMKVAPMARAFNKYPRYFDHRIVHTGQHYAANMSDVFFTELGIPRPHINLEIGSGPHGEQTGKTMIAFEKVCLAEKPDMVLVYGDVNSTIAAALVAAKLHIRIGHVESGLRSFDRAMPEEVNRVLTDAISDILFTPSPDGDRNLIKEGVPRKKIFMVGDIMVDSLLFNRPKAEKLKSYEAFGVTAGEYALLTLHRPSNVDDRLTMKRIWTALKKIAPRLPILFPVHPRTRKMLADHGIGDVPGVQMVEPLGYLGFLSLMMNSRLVLTDSGGIQEETTVLGVPCLTLRNSTERPVTITHGTNTLVWNDTAKIIRETNKILQGKGKAGRRPELWDGKTADRIVSILKREL